MRIYRDVTKPSIYDHPYGPDALTSISQSFYVDEKDEGWLSFWRVSPPDKHCDESDSEMRNQFYVAWRIDRKLKNEKIRALILETSWTGGKGFELRHTVGKIPFRCVQNWHCELYVKDDEGTMVLGRAILNEIQEDGRIKLDKGEYMSKNGHIEFRKVTSSKLRSIATEVLKKCINKLSVEEMSAIHIENKNLLPEK